MDVKYHFNGKVLPERTNVNIPYTAFANLHPQTGIKFRAVVWIGASQISANVVVENGKTDIFTLKNLVEDSIRAIVDAHGYCWGIGYDAEITSCTTPDEHHIVFGVGIGELEEDKVNRPLQPNEIIHVFAESMFLPQALADLRESIRTSYTGLFCYRAIECVRQHFYKTEDGKERDPSWQRLRENLNLSKEWINENIGKYGTPQRHAYDLFMSGDERVAVMKCAWQIVDRFCVFLKNGSKPLDKQSWPILK